MVTYIAYAKAYFADLCASCLSWAWGAHPVEPTAGRLSTFLAKSSGFRGTACEPRYGLPKLREPRCPTCIVRVKLVLDGLLTTVINGNQDELLRHIASVNCHTEY